MQVRSPLLNVFCPSNRKRAIEANACGIAVFVCLVVAEWVAFGNTFKRCGFYLDDWRMLERLYFGPQALIPSVLNCALAPLIIVRPIEAPYFATVYALFGLNPVGYHLVVAALEIVAAWFFYLSVARCGANRVVSFLAATMLLLYPIHDSSHYWVVCSSLIFSYACYMGSLWAAIEGTASRKLAYTSLSVALYLLSIFNYESFLPLCLLNIAVVFMLAKRQSSLLAAGKAAFGHALAYGSTILLFFVYQHFIVPLIGQGALHAVEANPATMLHIVVTGTSQILPTYSIPFFYKFIGSMIGHSMRTVQLVQLIVLVLSILAGVSIVSVYNPRPNEKVQGFAVQLIALGLIAIPLSFTIFGLNHEYEPNLSTILNRINCGAALGLSLVFAGSIDLMVRKMNSKRTENIAIGAAAIITAILAGFFCVTTWALSAPWIASWQIEQQYIKSLQKHASEIASGDTIMLAHCPRYFYWSPVFDGVWDFQSMARIILNNQKVNGGVVSQRLTMTQTAVSDISLKTVCASYPFSRMQVIVSADAPWTKVRSGEEFLATVVSPGGYGRGVDDQTIERWRRELAASVIHSQTRQ